MKKLITCGSVLLLGAALVLTTGACGGGGTTAAAPATTLNALLGPYCWTAWRADPNGPEGTTQWGTVDADGMAAVTPVGLYQNENGVVTGPMQPPAAAYTLGADNALMITTSGNTMEGALAADGTVAALGETKEGAEPGVLILGRTGSGFDLTSLAGDYHVCAFWMNDAMNIISWFSSTATFDGAGACTSLATISNIDGVINIEPPGPFGTYTVEDDGTLQWTPPIPIGPFEGGIYADGEVAVLTGATQAANTQMLMVLIRKGAGMDNSAFSGTYQTVLLVSSGASFGSGTVPVTADGAGAWKLGAGKLNIDGAIQAYGPSVNLPYEVGADGKLDFNLSSLRGAVSPSGRFAVVAGGTAANTDPQIWFFVR